LGTLTTAAVAIAGSCNAAKTNIRGVSSTILAEASVFSRLQHHHLLLDGGGVANLLLQGWDILLPLANYDNHRVGCGHGGV